MSPKKKKPKTDSVLKPESSETLKRENESEEGTSKRSKSVRNLDEEIQAQRRKNFVIACEQVSYRAYFDHRAKLLLIYLPSCMDTSVCKHIDNKNDMVTQIKPDTEEIFMIDARTNMWCEALEVCRMCITPTQYLSANVLKEIIEIMLNAHDDPDADEPVLFLIEQCQEILLQNFSTHPPCFTKRLRQCYNNFLTSPLSTKEKTFTNRTQFDYEKGIVKYCMNRLQYEISSESIDKCLVDKFENIPEEMKNSVKGLHWQKEKFEIYEVLERPERIERLMAVLETVIELLQFDLAIWHCRYTNNLGNHIMRSHKPLMAYILWSNNILYTGAVNANCRQILKIFVQLVHLKYPEEHIRIITMWLNTVIQTFYICETRSNSDYPNTGKYCMAFANEFYKIISEMPNESIIRVIEAIHPSYMKHLIGLLHLQKLLHSKEDCAIKIAIDFVKKSMWNKYPETGPEINLSKNLFPKIRKERTNLNFLSKFYSKLSKKEVSEQPCIKLYPKNETVPDEVKNITANYIIHTLYVTLEAYLDSFSLQNVQETIDRLNEKIEIKNDTIVINTDLPELRSYSVTEEFIKKYRYIFQMLQKLIELFREFKNNETLPDAFNIFEKIGLLEL